MNLAIKIRIFIIELSDVCLSGFNQAMGLTERNKP